MTSFIIINGKNPLEKTGGYQTYTYSLAKLIREMGYTVTILCFGEKTQTIETEIGELHIIHSWIYKLPFLYLRELTGLLFLTPILISALKKLVDDKPAIVYGIGPWSLPAAIFKLFDGSKKTILLSYYPTTLRHESSATMRALTVTDYGLSEKVKNMLAFCTIVPLYSLLEQFILRNSDSIVNHYISAEKILKKQFSFDTKKCLQLPYYIELSRKTVLQSNKNKKLSHPLILLISRHDGRKGINFLLHAFTILNRKKIKYSAIIIGDGPLLKKNKQLAKKLHLSNVTVSGFVADTSDYLHQADLFVFPSVEEGSSSISILEAMKEGLPIVSTNVDGIPEDLEHNRSALLVDPYDVEGLASSMEMLLKDTRLAKKLGAEAKKMYEKKHNRENTKKEFRIFLSKLTPINRSSVLQNKYVSDGKVF